jgi:hypothetical protein
VIWWWYISGLLALPFFLCGYLLSLIGEEPPEADAECHFSTTRPQLVPCSDPFAPAIARLLEFKRRPQALQRRARASAQQRQPYSYSRAAYSLRQADHDCAIDCRPCSWSRWRHL